MSGKVLSITSKVLTGDVIRRQLHNLSHRSTVFIQPVVVSTTLAKRSQASYC